MRSSRSKVPRFPYILKMYVYMLYMAIFIYFHFYMERVEQQAREVISHRKYGKMCRSVFVFRAYGEWNRNGLFLFQCSSRQERNEKPV